MCHPPLLFIVYVVQEADENNKTFSIATAHVYVIYHIARVIQVKYLFSPRNVTTR